jgi:hypothetical protein
VQEGFEIVGNYELFNATHWTGLYGTKGNASSARQLECCPRQTARAIHHACPRRERVEHHSWCLEYGIFLTLTVARGWPHNLHVLTTSRRPGGFILLYGIISVKIKAKWYLGEACALILKPACHRHPSI